ncbi:MAG: SRPBCC family protein [Melioribacteraceae bacterium]
MKLYTLYRKQELPISLDATWDFFSSPLNLKKMTPPEMDFEITSDYKNEKMFAGMIIEYIVRPVLGFPMRWVTEITHVKEKEYFVDEQRFGPYALWHHKHAFRIENDKVIMEDLVNYALPFGFLGRIAHRLFVKNRVEEIFNYRTMALNKMIKEGMLAQ